MMCNHRFEAYAINILLLKGRSLRYSTGIMFMNRVTNLHVHCLIGF
jgi:hypothetical protein